MPPSTSINRALYSSLKNTLPYSYSILSLSFILLFLLYIFFLFYVYLFTLCKSYLASSQILENFEKFLLYFGELAQYTVDKSLRTMNLQASGNLFVRDFVNYYTDMFIDSLVDTTYIDSLTYTNFIFSFRKFNVRFVNKNMS